MRNTLKDFKRRALARPDVHREYEKLKEEFELNSLAAATVKSAMSGNDYSSRIRESMKSVSHGFRPMRRGSEERLVPLLPNIGFEAGAVTRSRNV